MKIVCCDASSDAAQLAFRLRYEVFGSELNFQDPDIDHANGTYIDELDKHARIYVAIKDGKAIATARVIYDRDLDLRTALPDFFTELLKLEKFLERHAGALAISTKFAISPNHRGSLAAHMITAKMFGDFLDDGVHFLFSMCAPYLLNFYAQLGFRAYSRSIADNVGLVTPIVLATRDWRHLQDVRSPLLKQIDKRGLTGQEHATVRWFFDNYEKDLDAFIASYDEETLDKILTFASSDRARGELQDIGLFNAMSRDDVRKIVGSGKLMQFAAGDSVIQTGNSTDELFVVIDGAIAISIDGSGMPSLKVGPGQAFGEIAMLSRTARTADCVAISDTQLAIISRQNLERLMKVEPELSARLLYNLSRALSMKLLRTNETLKMLATAQ